MQRFYLRLILIFLQRKPRARLNFKIDLLINLNTHPEAGAHGYKLVKENTSPQELCSFWVLLIGRSNKTLPSFNVFLNPKSKLRQCNQSRSPNWLISWLNHLLIDFFNPNLSSESESSWQNQFQRLKKRLNGSKSNDFKWKEIELYWKWSKNSKYVDFFI